MHAHAAPRAEWSLEQHTSSGLLQRVRDSGVSVADAEAAVLAFARAHAPPNTLVLAGNSVGMDKRFIDRYMPELAAYLRHQARAAAAAVGPHPAAPLRRCAAAPLRRRSRAPLRAFHARWCFVLGRRTAAALSATPP